MNLAQLSQGRDNNLSLLRLAASIAVLVSHSYAISTGSPENEPLYSTLGFSLGTISVDIFFVISGFLVTGSLLRTGDPLSYLKARALRIFPGLWAMLIITCFLIGPWLSAASMKAYFEASELWVYLLKCGTLLFGVTYTLPRLFEANPYPIAVNGSLWSLPYEVKIYCALLLLWLPWQFKRIRPVCHTGFKWTLAAVATVAWCALASDLSLPWLGKWPRLFWMFFAGAAYFVFREHVTLSWRNATLVLVTLALLSTASAQLPLPVYALAVPYLTLVLAYSPIGQLSPARRIPDYSFGIYIYAFPVQQAIAQQITGVEPGTMSLITLAVVVPLAIASWHCIEKRALQLK